VQCVYITKFGKSFGGDITKYHPISEARRPCVAKKPKNRRTELNTTACTSCSAGSIYRHPGQLSLLPYAGQEMSIG